jgi:tRNA threonylcarbamoyladenosine biosynthesis protein TsaB
MSLLVLDTAMGRCTVAAWDGARCHARSEVMARGHQEALAPMAASVMAGAGLAFEALEAVGVTVGPGSFTGLRVGLAFAQGLGAALGVPVIGLPTLDALAASLPPGPGTVAAVIDARRGQVYARLFDDRAPVDEAQALAVEDFACRLAGIDGGGRLVGTGAGLFALPDWTAHPLDGPTPEALIARVRAGLEGGVMAGPRPLYLRAPDAVPSTRLPGQPRPPRP